MVGMLLSTFVLRRLDQKPSSIVTARTGTEWSLAYGELLRFRTPWSRHGSCVESTPRGAAEGLPKANASAGFATYEAAAVAAAASINLRRETGLEVVMDGPLFC